MANRIQKTILLTLSATVLGLGGAFALAVPALQEKPSSAPAAGTYAVDAVHSAIVFRIMHTGTNWAFGRFNKFSGEVVYDEKAPEKSSVKIEIEIDTIDTANGKRDDHLKSPDFFDAGQFPTASFTSKSVKKSGDKKYTVAGDLELHGVTKPLTFELEQVGASNGDKGVRVGYYATFSLKRSDFGIATMPDSLGDEVHVIASLATVKGGGEKR